MDFGFLNVNRLTHLRTGRLAEIKAGEVMEAASALHLDAVPRTLHCGRASTHSF